MLPTADHHTPNRRDLGSRHAGNRHPCRRGVSVAVETDASFLAIHPMRIEYHRTLLADRVRNAAFHAALQRVIVAGKTKVADIGAGTGFLGFMAAISADS